MALATIIGTSELSARGGDQELADACLDVFAQQIWEAAILLFFHKQRVDSVRILKEGAVEWSEVSPWSILCYSLGFDTASDNVGGAIEGLALNAIAVWPESGFFRPQGTMGIAGLDHKFRIALSGGTDSDGTPHQDNENLVWRAAWTAPPAGFKGGIEPSGGSAAHGIRRGPLATRYGSEELSLSGAEPCMINLMEFSTVYGVVRSTC